MAQHESKGYTEGVGAHLGRDILPWITKPRLVIVLQVVPTQQQACKHDQPCSSLNTAPVGGKAA